MNFDRIWVGGGCYGESNGMVKVKGKESDGARMTIKCSLLSIFLSIISVYVRIGGKKKKKRIQAINVIYAVGERIPCGFFAPAQAHTIHYWVRWLCGEGSTGEKKGSGAICLTDRAN